MSTVASNNLLSLFVPSDRHFRTDLPQSRIGPGFVVVVVVVVLPFILLIIIVTAFILYFCLLI